LGINEFEDFVFVTDKQWQLFVNWYGGGGAGFLRPVIVQGLAVNIPHTARSIPLCLA
jgi:hypothetical protein